MSSGFHSHSTLFFVVLVSAVMGCNQTKPKSVEPTADDSPAAVKVTFGHRQLDQLLSDRPDMQAAIPTEHPVRDWLIAGFNGKLVGQRIYWNAEAPASGRPAEHLPAYGYYPPQIRLANERTSPIDKWTMVVYEMFNMSNFRKFEAVQQKAVAGVIDAEEYAEEFVKLEFEALVLTRNFFNEFTLPGKPETDLWYSWLLKLEDDYDSYRLSHGGEPGSHGNFEYFKRYYLDEIVPYQERSR